MQLKTRVRDTGTLQKIAITVLVIGTVVSVSYPFETATKDVEVIEVIDGDTFRTSFNGETQSIRLKGVDTPETSGYNSPSEFKGVEQSDWRCLRKYGNRAKEFVSETLNETVTIRYRKGLLTVERGSFGRIIAEVKLENSTLGRKLIEKGLARSYGETYLELEREARQGGAGLWSCSN